MLISSTATIESTHAAQAAALLLAIAPHLKRLLAYARYVIGKRGADAEELLHEAIMTCHRRVERRGFDGDADAMVGYLYQQIKNQQRGDDRRAARHPTYELREQLPDLIEPEEEQGHALLPEEVATYLAERYCAADVQIWELHLQGISLTDTAEQLSMTKSSVHRHLEKIRLDLRQRFRVRDND